MAKKQSDWRKILTKGFGEALSQVAALGISEKESYEEALSIAEGWQMRLDEIEKEEKE